MPTLLNQLAQGLQVNGPTFVDRQLNRDLAQTQIDSSRLNQVAQQLQIDQARQAPAVEQQRAAMRQAIGGGILSRLPEDVRGQFEPFLSPQAAADPKLFAQGVQAAREFVTKATTPETFGQPVAGQEGFAQIGNRGSVRRVEGLTPRPQKPLVVVGGDQQKEEDKAFGRELVSEFTTIRERADAAEQTLGQLQLLRQIPVETGAFTEAKATIGAVAEAFGLPLSDATLAQISGVQSFIGTANNLVLNKMQAQKGPQTENDAKRIEQTLANVNNLADANRFLIDTAIAIETRAKDQEVFYRLHKARTGTFDGASQEWAKFKAITPMFGVNPNNGQPVFVNQFVDAFMNSNPGAQTEDALDVWREKYGNR